jgi:hypothetical protein
MGKRTPRSSVRVYHDPRYDRLATCPGCAGRGCGRCAHTGRTTDPTPAAGTRPTRAPTRNRAGYDTPRDDRAAYDPRRDDRAGYDRVGHDLTGRHRAGRHAGGGYERAGWQRVGRDRVGGSWVDPGRVRSPR